MKLEMTKEQMSDMGFGWCQAQVRQLLANSGALHVASARLKFTPDYFRNIDRYEVAFDPWYWTGRED